MENSVYLEVCSHCDKDCFDENRCIYWYDLVFCTISCLLDHRRSLNGKCDSCNLKIESDAKLILLRSDKKYFEFCSIDCCEFYKKNNRCCSFCFGANSRHWNERNKHCSLKCFQVLNRINFIDLVRRCFSCKSREVIQEITWFGGNDYHYCCSDDCMKKLENKFGKMKKCFQCKVNVPIVAAAWDTIRKSGKKVIFCCYECYYYFVVHDKEMQKCVQCSSVERRWEMYRKGSKTVWCSLRCMNDSPDSEQEITEGKMIFFSLF